jgi:hypothetical protein
MPSGTAPSEQARLSDDQRPIADADDGGTLRGLILQPAEQHRVVMPAHGDRRHDHIVGALRKALIELLDGRVRLDDERRAHLDRSRPGGERHHVGDARVGEDAVGDNEVRDFGAGIQPDDSDQGARSIEAGVVGGQPRRVGRRLIGPGADRRARDDECHDAPKQGRKSHCERRVLRSAQCCATCLHRPDKQPCIPASRPAGRDNRAPRLFA